MAAKYQAAGWKLAERKRGEAGEKESCGVSYKPEKQANSQWQGMDGRISRRRHLVAGFWLLPVMCCVEVPRCHLKLLAKAGTQSLHACVSSTVGPSPWMATERAQVAQRQMG